MAEKSLIVCIALLLTGCAASSPTYVDYAGVTRDRLDRDVSYNHIPACSDVTLKGDVKTCRVR